MEAMATRKPVVGFAIGGIPEIIDHERTGLLVEAENLHALAASISRLLDEAQLCDQLAGAGFAQSQARFDERLVNIAMERHFLDALGTQ
jgi:glycosyltransferase involved in cell wall biosynthesis